MRLRDLSRAVPFRVRLILVWATLLGLFVAFFLGFNLKLEVIAQRFPALAGLELTKGGFLQGAALTVFVTLCSGVCAVLLGLLAALGRLSDSAVAFGVSTFYQSFFRGTPLLVQIFLIYVGLPQLGPVPAALPSGIVALSLNYGAYLAEIFRAGIQAVPHGQVEAATALGLRRWVIFWKVVWPQAMRFIVPPTSAQLVAMLKDSSLISVMGVWEIMFLAQSFGRSTYRFLEMLITAALLYWALSLVMELIQARIERHYGKGVQVRGR
ncbi:MAG: amino acid ABC transporter permease [Geminicoccaceae bacterium]